MPNNVPNFSIHGDATGPFKQDTMCIKPKRFGNIVVYFNNGYSARIETFRHQPVIMVIIFTKPDNYSRIQR